MKHGVQVSYYVFDNGLYVSETEKLHIIVVDVFKAVCALCVL